MAQPTAPESVGNRNVMVDWLLIALGILVGSVLVMALATGLWILFTVGAGISEKEHEETNDAI